MAIELWEKRWQRQIKARKKVAKNCIYFASNLLFIWLKNAKGSKKNCANISMHTNVKLVLGSEFLFLVLFSCFSISCWYQCVVIRVVVYKREKNEEVITFTTLSKIFFVSATCKLWFSGALFVATNQYRELFYWFYIVILSKRDFGVIKKLWLARTKNEESWQKRRTPTDDTTNNKWMEAAAPVFHQWQKYQHHFIQKKNLLERRENLFGMVERWLCIKDRKWVYGNDCIEKTANFLQ